MQECLDSTVEYSAQRVKKEIQAEFGPRFDRQDETLRLMGNSVRQVRKDIRAEFGPRFDRQDETLRLMWRQCGGDPDRRLPVDD